MCEVDAGGFVGLRPQGFVDSPNDNASVKGLPTGDCEFHALPVRDVGERGGKTAMI